MEVGSIGAIIDFLFKTYGVVGAIIGVLLWFIKYLLDKNDKLTDKVTDLSTSLAKVTADSANGMNRLADGLIRGKGGE